MKIKIVVVQKFNGRQVKTTHWKLSNEVRDKRLGGEGIDILPY